MKNSRHWITITLGIATALLSSCAYYPGYYGAASSSYDNGPYAGQPTVRTSATVFISTGNPRWGYDPTCYSYYDYTTHCYYDPWLRGYYPRGYRPPIVVGVPHPHGWRSGRGICPPPAHVRNTRLSNYQQRHTAYQRLDYSWGRNVRMAPSNHRNHDYNRSQFSTNRGRAQDVDRYGRGSLPRNSRSNTQSMNRGWGSDNSQRPQYNRDQNNSRQYINRSTTPIQPTQTSRPQPTRPQMSQPQPSRPQYDRSRSISPSQTRINRPEFNDRSAARPPQFQRTAERAPQPRPQQITRTNREPSPQARPAPAAQRGQQDGRGSRNAR